MKARCFKIEINSESRDTFIVHLESQDLSVEKELDIWKERLGEWIEIDDLVEVRD